MKLRIFEIALFGMLGSLMFASKKLMEVFPNIHLLALLIIAVTIVFRWKAIFPICTFVFLDGLFSGFATWWVPYLYIWAILWGLTLLIPKKLPLKWASIIGIAIAVLHGASFGILYAPYQALAFGLSFEGAIAWIFSGLPFDLMHAIGNLFGGLLIYPTALALKKAQKLYS